MDEKLSWFAIDLHLHSFNDPTYNNKDNHTIDQYISQLTEKSTNYKFGLVGLTSHNFLDYDLVKTLNKKSQSTTFLPCVEITIPKNSDSKKLEKAKNRNDEKYDLIFVLPEDISEANAIRINSKIASILKTSEKDIKTKSSVEPFENEDMVAKLITYIIYELRLNLLIVDHGCKGANQTNSEDERQLHLKGITIDFSESNRFDKTTSLQDIKLKNALLRNKEQIDRHAFIVVSSDNRNIKYWPYYRNEDEKKQDINSLKKYRHIYSLKTFEGLRYSLNKYYYSNDELSIKALKHNFDDNRPQILKYSRQGNNIIFDRYVNSIIGRKASGKSFFTKQIIYKISQKLGTEIPIEDRNFTEVNLDDNYDIEYTPKLSDIEYINQNKIKSFSSYDNHEKLFEKWDKLSNLPDPTINDLNPDAKDIIKNIVTCLEFLTTLKEDIKNNKIKIIDNIFIYKSSPNLANIISQFLFNYSQKINKKLTKINLNTQILTETLNIFNTLKAKLRLLLDNEIINEKFYDSAINNIDNIKLKEISSKFTQKLSWYHTLNRNINSTYMQTQIAKIKNNQNAKREQVRNNISNIIEIMQKLNSIRKQAKTYVATKAKFHAFKWQEEKGFVFAKKIQLDINKGKWESIFKKENSNAEKADAKISIPNLLQEIIIKFDTGIELNKKYKKFNNLFKEDISRGIYKGKEKLDFASQGEWAKFMLSMLIDINNNQPLIIDQPEDDLDNIFIYEELAKLIASLSRSRQVIIITHNANIAFGSDSTNLIYCENKDNNYRQFQTAPESKVKHDIEIFSEEITLLNAGLEILEGGNEAFKKRDNIYNSIKENINEKRK